MKLHWRFFISCLAFLASAAELCAQTAPDSAQWDRRFLPNSLSGGSLQIVADRHGVFISTGVTGFPVQVGSTIFHGLAHWDGVRWTDLLPDTSTHNVIDAMALDSAGNLYVAGYFLHLGTLLKYDGRQWTVIDTDYALSGTVPTMATQDSLLLLSEMYSDSLGNSGIRLIIYDGHTIRHIPFDGFSLSRIAVKRDTVYLNGTGLAWISSPDSVRIRSILKWDGHACTELPSAHYDVFDLYANDSVLVVMGHVDSVVGSKPSMFALWNGRQWTNLQDPDHSTAGAIHVAYLGGTLYSTSIWSLSHWEGSSWVSNMSLAEPPRQIASTEDQLVLRGTHTCDSINIPGLLFWNSNGVTSPWKGPMLGLDDRVNTMTTFKDQLIVGGQFRAAGSKYVHGVAAWNGIDWSPLGRDRYSYFVNNDSIPEEFNADDDNVSSIVQYKGNLYAAGKFNQMNGIPATNIARWDGVSWHALAEGILHTYGGSDAINVMTVLEDGTLIVGGWFDSAGASPARNIAAWDGTTWHALDTTLNSAAIGALASRRDTIFAGGVIISDTEHHVMMRTPAGWSVVGDDLNGTVTSLTWKGDTLYAAGGFTASGNVPVLHVAKWDGTRWEQVGRGIQGPVNMLKVIDGKLLACTNQNYDHQIFEYQGGEWKPLGASANNSIKALDLYQGSICAGGAFTTLGDSASSHFGILHLPTGWLNVTSQPTAINSARSYPNPTDGILHLTIPHNAEHLTITNMLGEAVMDVTLTPRSVTEMQCDLSKYPKGVYLVRIMRPDWIDLQRVVKQ